MGSDKNKMMSVKVQSIEEKEKKKENRRKHAIYCINLLAPESFFKILAHSVYKM